MYEEVKTGEVVRRTLDALGIRYKFPVARTGIVATLGAARLLKESESHLKGTVRLIFQPAEEGGAGGDLMVRDGALTNPTVDRIFGLHIWPYIPTGMVGGRVGTFLAAAGSFEITVTGTGGHAAWPHLTNDPVATAAKLVTELQTLVSRAAANRCEATVAFPGNDYPPTINDAECWLEARAIATTMLGAGNVLDLDPVMGGEDFAFYGSHARACFMEVGTRNESIGATYSVHHPKFMLDEDALPIGTALHVDYARRFVS